MKYAIPLGGIAIIGMFALNAYLSQPVEVINEIEIIEEVHPDWATDQEAVEAAQAVIRRKELEAELDTVTADFEALEARKTELEKELNLY